MKQLSLLARVAGRVLLVLGCSVAIHGWAAPAAPAKPTITDAAEKAFWWGDFDELEREYAVVRQPGHFVADGKTPMALFRNGLALVFEAKQDNPEPYLRELEAQTLEWARAHPKSALAHTMHAQALLAHAWSYRGNGYVKDVPPEAWRDFETYLHRAVDYLKAHADVAFTDSYAHLTLLDLGRALDWDVTQLRAIQQDGLKRNPQDIGLYFAILTRLLPKWGGDPRTLDSYIRQTAEQTKSVYGMGMYARLYSAAAEEEFGHRLFEDSYANWALIKQGYADLKARFPDSPFRWNRYAYLACLAKDRATLAAALAELGPNVEAEDWGPNPERSLETCRSWAKQPETEKIEKDIRRDGV